MIGPIVTRGFGSFGSISLLPTRGFAIGEAATARGPVVGSAVVRPVERATFGVALVRGALRRSP